MRTTKTILTFTAAILSLAAAFLWLKSTLVKIPPADSPDEGRMTSASIEADGSDVIATARRQNYWNKLGALAASIAALAQGFSLLIPES